MKNFVLIILVSLVTFALCDMPTNCSYEDTIGKWRFYIGQSNMSSGMAVDCNMPVVPVQKLDIQLVFPNTVVDQYGNIGTWTMVYNQGFEVVLNGRRYFAFQFCYKTDHEHFISYCNTTFNGWVHDNFKGSFPLSNWGCYYARKVSTSDNVNHVKISTVSKSSEIHDRMPYGLKENLVEKINNHQSLWTAAVYPQFENLTVGNIIKMAGGRKNLPRIHPSKITDEIKEAVKGLPENFDWRNKNGVDFVSPIRNQGTCGSCYAFASMAQLEAGVRIATNNRIQPVLSPQYIVSCSNYSQKCEGGFPYLIAGKFAQDFGVIKEADYPYTGRDDTCTKRSTGSDRIYVSDYGYVGGYYGGCNEPLMRMALIKYGPLSVGINVTDEFMHYKGGIFKQTGLTDFDGPFNPFEVTNHAVLVVGYGVDHDSGVAYWIVKNSWGEEWGENGYFRIRRGTDEIAIESLAVYSKPYLGHA